MQQHGKLGFIGAGNMAEAMIGSIIRSGIRKPEEIVISDRDEKRTDHLTGKYGVCRARSNPEAAEISRIVVLAVKPQVLDDVLNELAAAGFFDTASAGRLYVSIAAGIPISRIEQYARLSGKTGDAFVPPVIRVMPNTPALVGRGMAGLCANSFVSENDIEEVTSILQSMGEVEVVDEEQMHAVTALSGSGPAYCFYLLEAMTEAGCSLGLQQEQALKLSLAAVSGAAALVELEGQDPQTLRSRVMSPGGTTEAAVNTLEAGGVKDWIIDAVLAAARRSRELSSPDDT